jgi:hypothetical protein
VYIYNYLLIICYFFFTGYWLQTSHTIFSFFQLYLVFHPNACILDISINFKCIIYFIPNNFTWCPVIFLDRFSKCNQWLNLLLSLRCINNQVVFSNANDWMCHIVHVKFSHGALPPQKGLLECCFASVNFRTLPVNTEEVKSKLSWYHKD